ncbi:MAG: site-specific integrase [Isosphaeraceae bacterium]
MISLLRKRMYQDLQLAGLAVGTQKVYVGAVRQLAAHYHRAPDQLTEQEVRDYILYLKNEKQLASTSLQVAASAIKFFYAHTVPRDWKTLQKLRIPKTKTLPDVLTINEVHQLIDAVHRPYIQIFFWTVYSLGLRVDEALHLQVGDIDSQRMLVHVHLGKGAKDRYVPLPGRTLTLLRKHWVTHRDPRWLFPAHKSDSSPVVPAARPMEPANFQAAMRQVVKELKFRKAITIHTLRHSYATHLLEAGLNLRLIQQYLGHSSLRTTMIYLHVTALGHEKARAAIEGLMAE